MRHHRIDYIELGVSDLAQAAEFYRRAFGWQFTEYGTAYAGIKGAGGDGEVGGLNPSRAPGTSGPLVLLFSDDLDASVTAVRDAGGQVTQGPYEFPGGRRFHFQDPSGNELGVWSPR